MIDFIELINFCLNFEQFAEITIKYQTRKKNIKLSQELSTEIVDKKIQLFVPFN